MIKLKLKQEEKPDDSQFIDKERLAGVGSGIIPIGDSDYPDNIQRRMSGDFSGHALYLPSGYDYVLGKDNYGATILIPLMPED